MTTLFPHRESSAQVSAAVIVFPGSNGDHDLLQALTLCGFSARFLDAEQEIPIDVSLVGLPGGFSYGDYWRAGVLASRSRAVRSLAAFLQRGGLVIGICNGFQILVESGHLPGALTYNHPPRFVHRWVKLRVTEDSARSPWFSSLPSGTELHFPIAHAEGSYRYADSSSGIRPAIPLLYEDNPNGSMSDAAAVLDDSGRILGIMPHPERACDLMLGSQDGLRLFQAAQRYLVRRPIQ